MRRSSVLRFVTLIVALGGSYAAHSSVSESASTGLHLVEAAVTPGAMADGSPIRAKTFYANEDIQFYTKISWDPAHGSGGTHQLLYKWYADDTPVLTFGGSKEFSVNPTYWWTFTHASHFSPGHHKVELYMDGALFASDEFDLFAGTRPNEPPEDSIIKATGRALLLKGDTREFDELAARYRESGERTASGTWKLSLLYSAIDRHWFAPADAVWDRLQNTSDAWLEEQPLSPTAVIVNARLLYWRAWAWRGDGLADQVAAQSWPHYRELLERARSVLDQDAAVARQDPEWEALRISIARQQGASSQSIRLAVWMVLLGCTVAYLLTTVPWGDPTETETVIGACIAVSVAGILMIWSRLRSRVVLAIDTLAVYEPFGRQILRRDDIEGVRHYVSSTRSRTIVVVPRTHGTKWLKVPPVWGEDNAFRLWFDSPPSLNEPPVPTEAHA